MERINETPPAVARFQAMGGVVEFVFFGDAEDTATAAREAVGLAAGLLCGSVNPAALRALPCRRLTPGEFLGEWVEPGTGMLRQRGTVTLSDGRRVTDPGYRQLDAWKRAGVAVQGSASAIPELWAGGEFAYAFAHPPYGLWATPGAVQEVFAAVCDLLLPPNTDPTILDWTGPELLALCPEYFEPGTEWWGVFLWTVQVPARRTVTVIAAASTD